MKKTLSGIFALGLVLAMFTGCQDPVQYSYSANPDELITLETPSIEGKSFYGYNYISWSDVNCNKYELTITMPNGSTDVQPFTDGELNYIHKVNTQGEYKYSIKAIPNNDPVRAFVFTASEAASVTLDAKIPGADYEFPELNSGNVSVKYDKQDNSFRVKMSGKPYLTYTYGFYKDEGENPTLFSTVSGVANSTIPYKKGFNKYEEDQDVEFSIPATYANGSYNLYIKSAFTDFGTSVTPVVSGKLINENIVINQLKEDLVTSIVEVLYTDFETGKSKLLWKPAKDEYGVEFGIDKYFVYQEKDGIYTKVDAPINVLKQYDTNTDLRSIYYIEDTVADPSKDIKYHVFLIDDTKDLAVGIPASITLTTEIAKFDNPVTISAEKKINDQTNKANDILVTYTNQNTDYGTTAKVYMSKDYGDFVEVTGFKPASNTSYENMNTHSVLLTDKEDGNYKFVVVLSKEGFKDSVSSSGNIKISEDPNVNKFAFDKTEFNLVDSFKVKVVFTTSKENEKASTDTKDAYTLYDLPSNYDVKLVRGTLTYTKVNGTNVPNWEFKDDKAVTFRTEEDAATKDLPGDATFTSAVIDFSKESENTWIKANEGELVEYMKVTHKATGKVEYIPFPFS